jgi:hypothetical protein
MMFLRTIYAWLSDFFHVVLRWVVPGVSAGYCLLNGPNAIQAMALQNIAQ